MSAQSSETKRCVAHTKTGLPCRNWGSRSRDGMCNQHHREATGQKLPQQFRTRRIRKTTGSKFLRESGMTSKAVERVIALWPELDELVIGQGDRLAALDVTARVLMMESIAMQSRDAAHAAVTIVSYLERRARTDAAAALAGVPDPGPDYELEPIERIV